MRIGAHSLWLPELERGRARALACALAEPEAPGFRAPADRLSEIAGQPSSRALAARGLRALGGLAAPVKVIERLDELMRAGAGGAPAWPLSDQTRQELGWSEAEAGRILKALGFSRARKAQPDTPPAWRPPRLEARQKPAARDTQSPFAALAALKPAPARKRRSPRHRARAS